VATRTLAVPVGDREVEVDLHTDTASAVAALARFVEAAGRYDDFKVGLDTETDSSKLEYTVKNPGPLRTIQVAGSATVEDGSRFTRALVLDMRDVDVTEIAPLLVQLPAYVWNIDFDYYVLAREGVWLQDVRDLLYTDLLLRNGKTGAYYRGLAVAARQYLGVEIGGKGTTQVSYDSHSDLSDEQISYAGLDAVVTVDLATPLEEAIAASGQETANELEWRASRGRMVMQLRGIGFELDRYTEALFDVEERRDTRPWPAWRSCAAGGEGRWIWATPGPAGSARRSTLTVPPRCSRHSTPTPRRTSASSSPGTTRCSCPPGHGPVAGNASSEITSPLTARR